MTGIDNRPPGRPLSLLICPQCGSADKPGAKPTIEINNGTVSCVACGHTWTPTPKDLKRDT